MKVIIVGAGIAGLSLAVALTQSSHEVVLVESGSELAELGAGVQMTPQAIKYLFRWGLKDDLMEKSIRPECMYIWHYKDGRLIGTIPLGQMDRRYGAPYIVIHRGILHSILHKHAVKGGTQIKLSSKVIKYDFPRGAVGLDTGETLEADLVVAADGINSFARQQLLGESDPGSRPTGWAAFRLSAEMSKIRKDPLIAKAINLDSGCSNFWVAPHKSCMTYLIKGATTLNIVLSHRDNIDTSQFSSEEYRQATYEMFRDFDRPVQRLLELSTPKIANFPAYEVPPLPKWTDSSGRFTLIGDAAHASVYFLSMGVSLAVEDATALSTAINYAETRSAMLSESQQLLCKAMQVFQGVRMRRVLAVQRASLYAGETLHVEDGEQRVALYEALSWSDRDVLLPPYDPNSVVSHTIQIVPGQAERCGPGGISDKVTRDWCYGFDADKTILDALESECV